MDISSVFYAAGMVTGIGLLVVFTCLIALIAILVVFSKSHQSETDWGEKASCVQYEKKCTGTGG